MDDADRSEERRDVPSLNDANWWQTPSWERIGQSIGLSNEIPVPYRLEEWETVSGQTVASSPPDLSTLLDVLKQMQALLAQTLTKLVEELQRRG